MSMALTGARLGAILQNRGGPVNSTAIRAAKNRIGNRWKNRPQSAFNHLAGECAFHLIPGPII
jgi:hypothetical protein